MKLISWNVNGLRAILAKNFAEELRRPLRLLSLRKEMKNTCRLCVLFILWIPVGSCTKRESSDAHHVRLEILFEDGNLNERIKATIVDDYTFILNSLQPKGRRNAQPRKIQINDNDITITDHFLFTAKYRYYPSDFPNEFGVIAKNDDGKEYLFVSKNLSDAYKEAIVLIDTHAVAFKALPDFLHLMNTMDKKLLPPFNQLVYFLGNGATEMNTQLQSEVKEDKMQLAQYAEQFVAEFGVYNFEVGSILETFLENKLLYVKIFLLKKDSDERAEGHVVYEQERWKLLIPLY